MESTSPGKRDFIDLRTRAEFLDLCGECEEAQRLRALSLETGCEVEINCYAYQLLWRSLPDQAIELMRINVVRHPDSWNAWDSLAEAYESRGDILRAIECYEEAWRLTDDEGQRQRIKRRVLELHALDKAS